LVCELTAKTRRPSGAYFAPTRSEVNLPVLAGTDFASFGFCPCAKKATLPEIEVRDSNLPLKTRIPGLRPTLPMGNSISPEKVTWLESSRFQVAFAGSAGGRRFDRASRSRKVPSPEALAANSRSCFSVPRKVNLTFQRPARSGACSRPPDDCAAMTKRNPKRKFIVRFLITDSSIADQDGPILLIRN
jgi:hypothetical protein